MIKKFILLSLFISVQVNAKWHTHSKIPKEIDMLIDYISEDQDISLELEAELNKLNEHLQKYHSNSKNDAYFSLNISWILRNSFYKWFLIKASSLEKSKNIIPINKPLSKDFAPYERWIYKNIHNDIENIIVNYSKKKITFSNLSKVAQKKISLLSPWVALFRRNKMPQMLRQELLPLTLDHLIYINKQVSAYNIISGRSTNTLSKTNYITKAITDTQKPIINKTNGLPLPVDDWADKDRYKLNKPTELGKDGLPLPVDDWILDF